MGSYLASKTSQLQLNVFSGKTQTIISDFVEKNVLHMAFS
jgi:hypothetical protein